MPSVSEVDSVLRLIPDDQQEKIAIVKSFEPLVAPVRIGRSSRVDLDRLREALAKIKRRFDVMAAEAGDKLPEDLAALREKTTAVLRQLASADRETAEPALNYLQAQLYRDFVSKFYSLQHNLHPERRGDQGRRREDLRRKFVGASGDVPDADPPQGGHLGTRGRAAVRDGAALGGPGRDGMRPSSRTRPPG